MWGRFDPPELPSGLLPPTIESFAREQGAMMGVDPGGLAAAALAVCAAAIPDNVKLQPKLHDPTWAELARLWVALVGDPSTKKSPTIAAAVRPLAEIDTVVPAVARRDGHLRGAPETGATHVESSAPGPGDAR